MRIITKDNIDLSKPVKKIKKPKRLKQRGKQYNAWLKARRLWFKEHPADVYICYLCGRYMSISETTLDHIIPRSRASELRYEQSNLKPCCSPCNSSKGSKVYVEYNYK